MAPVELSVILGASGGYGVIAAATNRRVDLEFPGKPGCVFHRF